MLLDMELVTEYLVAINSENNLPYDEGVSYDEVDSDKDLTYGGTTNIYLSSLLSVDVKPFSTISFSQEGKTSSLAELHFVQVDR